MALCTAYQLVHSLSPSEKRYFKVFIGGNKNNSSNKYIQLFDALIKQDEYNETKLLKKLGYVNNKSRFSVAKSYLVQLILKCLRNYHAGNSTFSKCMEGLLNVEMLYRKKLFKACQKEVRKVQKLASSGELGGVLLLSYFWEVRLFEYLFDQADYWSEINNIINKIDSVSTYIKTDSTFEGIYEKIRSHNILNGLGKNEKSFKEFESLMKNPSLDRPLNTLTIRSKIFFYMIHAVYYEGLLNYEEQYIWSKKLFNLFESNHEIATQNIELYIKSLGIYYMNRIRVNDLENFQEDIEQLKNLDIPSEEYSWRRRKEYEYLYIMLNYNIHTGLKHNLEEVLLPQIEQYFNLSNKVAFCKEELAITTNLSYTYLCTGKIDDALHWANLADRMTDKNTMVDVYIYIQFLLLAIHYELKNPSLINSLANSLSRFLTSKNKKNIVYGLLVQFFLRVFSVIEEETKCNLLFLKFKKDLMYNLEVKETRSSMNPQLILWWLENQLSHSLQSLGKVEPIDNILSVPNKTLKNINQTDFYLPL